MNYKSLLFVPAKEKTLGKIPDLTAEACIIDLEDSIEASDKELALNRVCSFLKDFDSNFKIFIRVNSDRINEEINALKIFSDIGFMIPKFEDVGQYSSLIDFFHGREIIALIETPIGVINSSKIAECPWISAVAFGAEDYTARMNMKNSSDLLIYPKCCLINAAKAYGKKAYDTPSMHIKDDILFMNDLASSVDLGFDGKLAIHPKHIQHIKNAFMGNDIDNLIRIVSTYEKIGQAVSVIDGVVYETMHIERMKKILKENGGNT